MSKIEPRILKGFRDYGPSEQLARQNMFSKIQSVFERFGFLPLSTPVLEYKDILMGKYGEDEKLIYNFVDKGDREVAMRYDLTVPLARYVAQNQGQLILPFKRYQIAPVWRADNPQKGRLREFYQCDIDTVGTDSPLADAETIACVCQALESLGITDYKVRLNDRAVLKDLSAPAIRALDKIDKIGLEGIVEEMKSNQVPPGEIETVKSLIADGSNNIPENIAKLINLISSFGIKGSVEFDPSIARGLDYYTGTVFEIYVNAKPEYGSVCSGGRYDNLVDQYSDKSLSAVGGSIGIDRLLGALYELNLVPEIKPIQAMVFNLSESLNTKYAEVCGMLRASNINTELYYSPAKIEKQFKYAESKNIPFAILLGEEEKSSGKVLVKNLQTREQQELSLDQLVEFFKKI